MSITQISGGLVSIEDSKKHTDDEFGRRKVRVELTFGVADNDDYQTVFDQVSEAASNRVLSLLNGTALTVVKPAGVPSPMTAAEAGTATLATPPADPSAVVDEPTAEPEKPKRVRRTQAQIAADKAAAAGVAGADPSAVVDEDPTTGATEGDPSAIVDEEPEVAAEDDFTIQPEVDPSAVVDAEFTIEPDEGEPVTDADLNDAVMKKNAALGNPTQIRELIKGYNPDPKKVFQLRDIPNDQRQKFLAELNALTATAA